MDPNETLKQINAFLARGDEGDEVDIACQDLFDWIRKGGFKPDWSKYSLAASYYDCREVTMRKGNP